MSMNCDHCGEPILVGYFLEENGENKIFHEQCLVLAGYTAGEWKDAPPSLEEIECKEPT